MSATTYYLYIRHSTEPRLDNVLLTSAYMPKAYSFFGGKKGGCWYEPIYSSPDWMEVYSRFKEEFDKRVGNMPARIISAKHLVPGDRLRKASGVYVVMGLRFTADHPKTYEIGIRYENDTEVTVLKDVDPDKEFIVERP